MVYHMIGSPTKRKGGGPANPQPVADELPVADGLPIADERPVPGGRPVPEIPPFLSRSIAKYGRKGHEMSLDVARTVIFKFDAKITSNMVFINMPYVMARPIPLDTENKIGGKPVSGIDFEATRAQIGFSKDQLEREHESVSTEILPSVETNKRHVAEESLFVEEDSPDATYAEDEDIYGAEYIHSGRQAHVRQHKTITSGTGSSVQCLLWYRTYVEVIPQGLHRSAHSRAATSRKKPKN
ncbi:hypothetical protein F4779DRAFT_622375 [Xylariaceae sp. FL0662B]|nr:hypothetical protein F4779DRAFT_622375 [Xylariaceae sp. FL0662B]